MSATHQRPLITALAPGVSATQAETPYTLDEQLFCLNSRRGTACGHEAVYREPEACLSGCGTVVKKDLSERWHSCECGTELDRDHNAALNILALGRRVQVAQAS